MIKKQQLPYFCICCSLILFSCKPSGNIKGIIKDMPLQQIILEEIQTDKNVFIDSASTKPDGSFALSAVLSEEKLYRISFLEKKFILIPLEKGDKINIEANWQDIQNYTVSGSRASAVFKSLVVGTRESINALNTMDMILQKLEEQKANDSTMKAAMADLLIERTKFKDYLKQFADTTHSVNAAVFAANLIDPKYEIPFITHFYDVLDKRFPNSSVAKIYKERFLQSGVSQAKPTAPTGEGVPAPDFSSTTIDGNTLKLSDYRGKYVFIDFWASWCGPCRGENPNVVEAYKKYSGKNIVFIGVSLDTDKDKWAAAIQKDNLTWKHVSDLKGWSSAIAQLYNVQSIPANFLIDPHGNIVAQNLRGPALEQGLEKFLK